MVLMIFLLGISHHHITLVTNREKQGISFDLYSKELDKVFCFVFVVNYLAQVIKSITLTI